MNSNRSNLKEERKAVGIGFIKSRKAEQKVIEYGKCLVEVAEKEGCELLFVDVDCGGDRDIDRPQLDVLYSAMKLGCVSRIYIRRLKDITDNPADLLEFHKTARECYVSIHVVNVEDEDGANSLEVDVCGHRYEVWDGGAGC